MTALTLNLESIAQLTHRQFRELCRANPDLKLEWTATGELSIMPPTGLGIRATECEPERRSSDLELYG